MLLSTLLFASLVAPATCHALQSRQAYEPKDYLPAECYTEDDCSIAIREVAAGCFRKINPASDPTCLKVCKRLTEFHNCLNCVIRVTEGYDDATYDAYHSWVHTIACPGSEHEPHDDGAIGEHGGHGEKGSGTALAVEVNNGAWSASKPVIALVYLAAAVAFI